MTSFKQIEANRRNAQKSTGPITDEGKQQSRCNAVRHGLTAETVIGALEDAEDYKAFEAAIIADYCVFRRKAATDSDASRPLIPTEVGHPFRSNPATLVRPF
jgi:hypothetical protein